MSKRNKTIRILFTSVGRRVELMQAFRKAAALHHVPLCLYGADLTTDAPALFYCDKQLQVCRIRDKEYIPQLLEICRREEIDLLIPTIDTDLLLLAQNKELFEAQGTKVMISSVESVSLCRDKRFTTAFFEKCGVSCPSTVDDVDAYKGEFPCFIKPKDGSSSINAYKVDTPEDLRMYASQVEDYIIQDYISGREFTIDILCDFEGNPVFITPRERVMVRSGEVLKTQIVSDETMEKEALAIVKEFRPCGPITVQLIQDERTGKNFYIEINPRFGGGAPLSVKAGANAPLAILKMLQGEKTAYNKNAAKEGLVFSRFDQSICVSTTGINVIDDILAVETVCKEERFVVFDLDDTLYGEKEYVRSGYRLVAEALPQIKDAGVKLWDAFEKGLPAIDTVLNDAGIYDETLKKQLLEIYREQMPEISLYPGVKEMLERMRANGVKIGIITDGRPSGQHNKIKALGLEGLADEILITDELAGNGDVTLLRKPCEIPFEIMKLRLGTDSYVYVGNNYRKDIALRNQSIRKIWFHNEDEVKLS